MNPIAKLEEIENDMKTGQWTTGNLPWLIARVKRLTAALEKIKNPDMDSIDGMIITDMGLKHFVSHTARKALEDESGNEN